jgi:hypothetical protein
MTTYNLTQVLPIHPLLEGVTLDPNALMIIVQQNLTKPYIFQLWMIGLSIDNVL